MNKKPVALIIMDGFGLSDKVEGNAIYAANTKNFDNLFEGYPHTTLGASGEDVGLPDGQMGNSEVGHLNIGAGRTVYQSLTRINVSIKDGSFYQNPAFIKAALRCKENNSKFHIFALCSDGGVHSHMNHIFALLDFAKMQGLSDDKIYVHAFLDGRDVPPKSAEKYLKAIMDKKIGHIATVSGRYYAMDRDNNWDRLQVAYDAITQGKGEKFDCPLCGLKASYEKDVTDEFVVPFVTDLNGMVEDGDSVVFANFRPDRAIRIATAISNPGANGVDTSKGVHDVYFVSMMLYADSVKGDLAFGLQDLTNTYGEVVSNAGMTQLRIAETEKYAHVTFFFDGGVDKEIKGSKRILVNSPKDVATYDLKPEMSAYEVTEKVLYEIEHDCPDTIILNFANCDMVGHTGVFDATVKAVETVDECMMRVVDAVVAKGGVALITADHGNAEKLIDENGKPFTAHTTNKVPLIVTMPYIELRDGGTLGDIAPTMLELLGVEQPCEMTGKTLIKK